MAHVVTHPAEPFLVAGDRLEVHQVPADEDNLVWVLICRETREAAVVDGPDAEGALALCERLGARLTTVLNTHTHGDHIGVNRDLGRRGLLDAMAVIGPAKVADEVPGLTRGVGEGDLVQVGNVEGRVWLTEGHIHGHISFLFDGAVLCGDTMFAGGCGYLFGGDAPAMFHSLMRLAGLPGATRVCCAHEYTQDNLRFAWSVEPDNEALAERIRRVWPLRAAGGCAVPSTIEEERSTNPFLRPGSPTLRREVGASMGGWAMSTHGEVFAATRELKNRKLYRAAGEAVLPLKAGS